MRFARERYAGIWVPLVTPFRDDEPDLDALVRIVDWLLDRGVQGLVVLGSTGERPHLSAAEAARVVRSAVEAASRRVPVMVGAGHESTRETLRAIDAYAALGADAVLVLPPFYYRKDTSPDTLGAHYAAVAAGSPLPVFVYHVPQITGIDLEASLLVDIVSHPNVWGFKDSSVRGGPLAGTLQAIAARGLTTRAFVGGGGRVVEALEAGACGGILAVAHVLPEICVRLVQAFGAGRRAEAVRFQGILVELLTAIGGAAIAGVKCGLRLRGMDVGPPRLPLAPATPAVEARVEAVLAAAAAAARNP